MEIQTFSELFNNRTLRIIGSQNKHVLRKKNLVELWNNLERISIDKNGKFEKHYAGTILLKKITSNSDKHLSYDIIDGVEYLTTIYILLLELLQDIKKDAFPIVFYNNSVKRLQYAKNFFNKKVKALSGDKKEFLFQKITTSLLFNVLIIDDNSIAQFVLDTKCNAGKALSISDLIKVKIKFWIKTNYVNFFSLFLWRNKLINLYRYGKRI